jgi:hypothetical protein
MTPKTAGQIQTADTSIQGLRRARWVTHHATGTASGAQSRQAAWAAGVICRAAPVPAVATSAATRKLAGLGKPGDR